MKRPPPPIDGPTRIIVSLTHADEPLAAQVDQAEAAGAELVELRADLIGDLDAVRALLRGRRTTPLLLTLRGRSEGGACDDDDQVRVARIEELGLLQPGWIDVEWQTWRRSANLRQKIGLVCRRTDGLDDSAGLRAKNELLLSYHDPVRTPPQDELTRVLDELEQAPAAVVKAVFTAADALDALRVLDQLRARAGRRAWVLLAMGAAGLATRVLAKKFGAFGTFAALEAGRESAPGQIPCAALRALYRWDALGPATRVFGVVGWPVGHSRSPRIHNAAMLAGGVDGVYLPLPVRPEYESFAAFMDFATAAGGLDMAGLSVTLPHKEHALRWLRERGHAAGELARQCGAVNTLVRTADGGWRGENTDVSGLLAALATRGAANGGGRTALVLGAGGVARAAITALRSAGWSVVICNRGAERGAALAGEFGVTSVAWEERESAAWVLLVNATSVGMTPDSERSPLPAGMAGAPRRIVLDTVYTPEQTRLLQDAARAGATTISGVEMFLAQAAEQYRLWHAARVDPAVLRQAFG